MSALDSLPPLREVINAHGLAPKKSLGQNFLLDLNLTSRIARSAGDLTGCDVLEIGPGPGGLTRALLAHGARKVVAIERDDRCIAALAEVAEAYPGRLETIPADALTFDPSPLLTPPVKIVANLPYNIGTELLIRWLTPEATGATWPPFWESATLMFQREVAERAAAAPGARAYGRLSVLTNWRATPQIQFEVPPQAFTPPPKVVSAILTITPRSPVAEAELSALERVTAAAFGQRRKMLRQSLKSLGMPPGPLLEAAGVAETRRAETVDIEGFCALARAYRAAV